MLKFRSSTRYFIDPQWYKNIVLPYLFIRFAFSIYSRIQSNMIKKQYLTFDFWPTHRFGACYLGVSWIEPITLVFEETAINYGCIYKSYIQLRVVPVGRTSTFDPKDIGSNTDDEKIMSAITRSSNSEDVLHSEETS